MKKLILILCFLFLPLSVWADTLAWDAPTTGGVVDGYILYYWSEGDAYCSENDKCHVSMPNDVRTVDVDILNLLRGIEYNFAVRAYNTVGESGDSNIVSYTLPPYQPQPDKVRPATGTPDTAVNMTIITP